MVKRTRKSKPAAMGSKPLDLEESRSRMRRVLATALVTGAALITFAGTAACDEPSDVEALRVRVEAIRSGENLEVNDGTIAARTLLAAVYERRGFERAWSDPARADALLRAIRDSERDGLDPNDYHLRVLEEASRSGAPNDIELDLVRTDALIRLGYHILFGKVDPTTLDPDWNYERVIPDFDPVLEIERAFAADDLAAWLESWKPTHPYYARLRDALAKYRAIRDSGGWLAIPAGAALAPGDSDARIPALRARLAVTGDIAPGADVGASESYDDSLLVGVRRFQARHGLEEDGVVGPRTIEELNVSVEQRIDQIRLNLERGRWLLHDLGGTFVIVNIAGFRLLYVRDGAIDWETRVQVGTPYRATPVFRSDITYLVLNPTWTVPPTILREDILPAQRRDPTTLARKGLKVLDQKGREVPASAVNWSSRSFPYTLRQDPGPTNALGRVKFMFPNAHAVYLHDTPSKNLFEADDRAFSSGCIRVEDPLALAERLLADDPNWNRAAIDRAIESGKTKTVTLKTSVPVLLSYWTAWVPRSGELQFRRDIYGRDVKILAGLASEFRMRKRN